VIKNVQFYACFLDLLPCNLGLRILQNDLKNPQKIEENLQKLRNYAIAYA